MPPSRSRSASPISRRSVKSGRGCGSASKSGEAVVREIGAETYEQLPDGAVVERRTGLRVKGKEDALEAYLLFALP